MISYIADRLAIADLLTGWMRRDLGQWDQLRELFHPEGLIAVTWFEGRFSDFVKASERMSASGGSTKHFIASPVVTFNGGRAIAETNTVIVSDNHSLGLGCTSHARFYDLVEKRNGLWRILNRQALYDLSSFTFPRGYINIEDELLAKHPREYAALAYLLEKSGYPVKRVFPTNGSELEKSIKDSGKAWLSEEL